MADERTREQADPLIGMQVNGFIIQRKLAEGGMGAVYVCQHERLTNIHKVIKVLLPTYAQDPTLRQRFEREAESASRLHHEHILRIDNFGSLPDGQLWLMTEFLHGQPLDELLRTRGRLAEHHALLVILQLCSALEHAHKAGIVHRDVKPGNVFVCPTQAQPLAIKLLDFGIAKILHTASDGAHTRSGVAIGTPSYMAVEQYDRADEVTARADIFSLAVMTCEMITGRLPWGRHDPAVLYHQQRTRRPVLDGLSPGWRRVLQDALAAEPKDRPESACAYARALASETPALSPCAPGGVEMLRMVAPDLMDSAAPVHAAVHTRSDRESIAPRSWSTLTSPQAPPQKTTTISASPGVIAVEPPRRHARSQLVLAGLGACGLAGLVTFALVRSLQGTPSHTTAAAPTSLASPQAGPASSPPGDAPVSEDASAAPAMMVPDAARSLSSAVAPSARELQRTPPPRGVRRPRPPAAPARPPQPAADDDTFDPDSPIGR
ncbi:MAG TPA: protein kinase [Kofleriaceae bacterium]